MIIPFTLWAGDNGFRADENETIAFLQKEHDFGIIKEAEGAVSYEFKFINEGNQPIIVQNVKPSCGCTTPGWTREPVQPGDTGVVKALFDPSNRPGAFVKTLVVNSNAKPNPLVLKIKGIVRPIPKSPEQQYPVSLGNLRTEYSTINLGRVYNNGPIQKTFEIYNSSNLPLTISEILSTHAFEATAEPMQLQPQETGQVIIDYNPKIRNELGFFQDNLTLITDDTLQTQKSFTLVANVEEYFPPISEEELKIAPKMIFEKKLHDFGAIRDGEVVETSFTFVNEGRRPLNIRKIVSNCNCTTSDSDRKDIQPGETGEIVVKFDGKGRNGYQTKFITLYTNDPIQPVRRLTIKAKII